MNVFSEQIVHSKKCGTFHIVDENSQVSTSFCQNSSSIKKDEKSYNTPGSDLVIIPEQEVLQLSHKNQKILDFILLKEINFTLTMLILGFLSLNYNLSLNLTFLERYNKKCV
jgi:hypothetical protein